MRKLVIIGNGLGMSLSPNGFSLKSVMPKVWENELNDAERNLIASCIEGIEENGPTNEAQLMGAQVAQMGHEMITTHVEERHQSKWFTKEALTYPEAIGKYVYEVAKLLNKNSQEFENDVRLKGFLDHFIPFQQRTKSHIATLNYDTVLYSAFNDDYTIEEKQYRLCNGWNGTLVDGYTRTAGFSEANFVTKYDSDFGYYLHLHGSPLFVDEPARKLNRNELAWHAPNNAKHIILSDGTLKPLLIMRSDVLKLYWKQLRNAVNEAEEIIIFGYGGGDEHLNAALRKSKVRKRVVVRKKADKEANNEAAQFWVRALGSSDGNLIEDDHEEVIYEPLDDILEFRNWG